MLHRNRWFAAFLLVSLAIVSLAAVSGQLMVLVLERAGGVGSDLTPAIATMAGATAGGGLALIVLLWFETRWAGVSRAWTLSALFPVLGLLFLVRVAWRIASPPAEDSGARALPLRLPRSRWVPLGFAAGSVATIALSIAGALYAQRIGTMVGLPQPPRTESATSTSSTSTPMAGLVDPVAAAAQAMVTVDVFRANRLLYTVSGALVGDSRHVVMSLGPASAGEQLNVVYEPPGALSRVFRTIPVAFDGSLGLAVLLLEDAAGRPLEVATQDPRAGDPITLAAFAAEAQWVLRTETGTIAEVTTAAASNDVRWLRSVLVPPAHGTGGVMLDPAGRLLGIATNHPGAPLWDRTHAVSVASARTFLDQASRATERITLPAPPVEALRPGSAASTPSANATLPYKVYGSGLRPGQIVEVRRGDVPLARATVNADGNWSMDLREPTAVRGEALILWLDGAPTGRAFNFVPGQFAAPPGIMLGSVTPTPTRTPTPAGGTATASATASATATPPSPTPTPTTRP